MKQQWFRRLVLFAWIGLLLLLLWSGRGRITAAPVDVISNGTFANGLTAWSFFTDTSAQMSPSVNNGELTVDVINPGSQTFHLMVRQPYRPIVNGSTYILSFDARAAQTRSLFVKVGQISSPYASYGDTTVNLTTAMQPYQYTFTMNQPSDPCAVLEFHLGTSNVDVVLDNVQLVTEDTAVVPPTGGVYTTPSTTGHPLRTHADELGMDIGSAAGMTALLCDPDYSAILSTEFDSITPENAMKMSELQPVQGEYLFGDADAVVAYAQAHDMKVHGHTLVWHSQQPGWLVNGNFNRQQMLAIMYDYIDTVMGRYQGQIPVWDVVNEAIEDGSNQLRNSFWRTRIGDDYIDLAFIRARQADPNAILLYNDYNIADLGGKSNAVYNLTASMVNRGIPIDGVGFQMHLLESGPPSAASVASNMARYAALGLDVYVTEIDVRIQEPVTQAKLNHQAQIYADMLTVCRNAPNCRDFTTWGLSDRYSWIPETFPGYDGAHLFDDDYNAKPAYHALISTLSGTPPPTATPVGSATTVPTMTPITPTGTAVPGTCQVNYVIASQWNNGFTANVTITNNNPAAIQGWSLNWNHAAGQQVTAAWNATVTQTGNSVSASNPANHWNGTIPANGGSVSFGFQGTHTGLVVVPTAFTLNGQACNQTGPTPTATTNPPTVTPTTQPATATPTNSPPTATPTNPPPTNTPMPPTATATAAPPSPTPTVSSGGACTVNYALTNDWGSGFLANVTITNNAGTAVNGWTLAYTFPGNQNIVNLWNGVHTQTGTAVTVNNAGWNPLIPANGSVSFGFQASYSGSNLPPALFSLNGMTCN